MKNQMPIVQAGHMTHLPSASERAATSIPVAAPAAVPNQ